MSEDDTQFLRNKVASMKKTAYIRLDLAERLQFINYINLIITVILSMYLAGWAMFVAFFPDVLTENDASVISYVGVVATFSISMLTILDFMADRSVKSKFFLDSGNKILKKSDDLEFSIRNNLGNFHAKSILDSYHEILKDSSLNHGSEDNDLYLAKSNMKNKKCLFNYLFYVVKYFWYIIKRIFLQVSSVLVVGYFTISLVSKYT